MFSAGVVKLLGNDEIWMDLKALKYHFVSQPLPTPLGYYVHVWQPSWMARIGVAGTLWIEILVVMLVLVPFRSCKRFAVGMNWALMGAIMLTGNYNFFNLLTCVLFIPLLDDDVLSASRARRTSKVTTWINGFATVMCFVALAVATALFFRFSNEDETFPVMLNVDAETVQHGVDAILPVVLGWTAARLVWGTYRDMYESWRYDEAHDLHVRAALGVISMFVFVMCAIPMVFSLTPNNNPLGEILPHSAIEAYRYVGHEFSSSYGLFRSMTGVGKDGHPSVPQVRFTALVDAQERPLRFKYYPSDDFSAPSINMPLQPRLDWQLWFLSLSAQAGRPANDAWLIAFCDNLLLGEPAVWSLLAKEEADSMGKIVQIKIELVHVDFASLGTDGKWWVQVPGDVKRLLLRRHKADVKLLDLTPHEPWMNVWIEHGQSIATGIFVVTATIAYLKSRRDRFD